MPRYIHSFSYTCNKGEENPEGDGLGSRGFIDKQMNNIEYGNNRVRIKIVATKESLQLYYTDIPEIFYHVNCILIVNISVVLLDFFLN